MIGKVMKLRGNSLKLFDSGLGDPAAYPTRDTDLGKNTAPPQDGEYLLHEAEVVKNLFCLLS
jgi:hypothetical protein